MTTDLLKRLESGETGREIDAEVFRHLGYTVKMIAPFAGSAGGRFLAYPPNGPERCEPARLAITTSLDAAVALVERVLPGWRISLDQIHPETINAKGWTASVCTPDFDVMFFCVTEHEKGKRWLASAPTPAAALVAALLKAEG